VTRSLRTQFAVAGEEASSKRPFEAKWTPKPGIPESPSEVLKVSPVSQRGCEIRQLSEPSRAITVG